MRAACVVEVPFMCGDASHPAAEGPARCATALRAALGTRAARMRTVTVERPTVAYEPSDMVAASLAVNARLAELVRQARARGELPLVLAGSCDASLGILAGLDHAGVGVVWLDAHGDFNTPASSVSGFFPGMSLAVLAGHCHQREWARIGGGRAVPEAAIALIGVRDLSPDAERERLERSAIGIVPWRGGASTGAVRHVLDAVAERVRAVYLHIDLDALDPHVAPGIVDDPVPGGLALEDAEAIVRGVCARFEVRAAAITTYVPERDSDDRTLSAILRLAQLLLTSRAP
jgi:arginase